MIIEGGYKYNLGTINQIYIIYQNLSSFGLALAQKHAISSFCHLILNTGEPYIWPTHGCNKISSRKLKKAFFSFPKTCTEQNMVKNWWMLREPCAVHGTVVME